MMIDATATIRGVTIGRPPYQWVAEPAGLIGTAGIRVDDRDRPNDDGVIAGADYLSSKSLTFELAILGDSPTHVETLTVELEAAFATSRVDLPLDVRVSGTPAEYQMIGRPRGCYPTLGRPNEMFGGFVAYAQCRFEATDPIRYSLEEFSVVVSLGEPGESYLPFELPVFLGEGGSSGEATVVNAGSTPVPWIGTLNGALTNPRLTLVETGQFMGVQSSIAVGSTVVSDGGDLLLDGVSPRPAWLRPGSSPFLLPPGLSTLRLTADAGSGNAVVTGRSGWA